MHRLSIRQGRPALDAGEGNARRSRGRARRVGEEGGMTAGVAKLLLDKRQEIERVFAEHDRMVEAAGTASEPSGDVIPIKEAK